MLHSHMPTRWKLKAFLDNHAVSVYAVAKELEGEMSRTALYNLTRDPKAIHFETFDSLIPALRKLTGKEVAISDLLEFEGS